MRNPNSKTTGLAGANLLAMAVGGLIAGAAVGCKTHSDHGGGHDGGEHAEAAAMMKHACKGMNACKGQGGCGTDKNACAGKNECKGQGGCATAEHHSCKGANECKGQGGCSTGNNGCAGKNDCKGHGGCAVPVKH